MPNNNIQEDALLTTGKPATNSNKRRIALLATFGLTVLLVGSVSAIGSAIDAEVAGKKSSKASNSSSTNGTSNGTQSPITQAPNATLAPATTAPKSNQSIKGNMFVTFLGTLLNGRLNASCEQVSSAEKKDTTDSQKRNWAIHMIEMGLCYVNALNISSGGYHGGIFNESRKILGTADAYCEQVSSGNRSACGQTFFNQSFTNDYGDKQNVVMGIECKK